MIFILLISITGTFAQFQVCKQYPPEVQRCFAEATSHPVDLRRAHDACLRRFHIDDRPNNNMTMSDEDFFAFRSRIAYGLRPPPTGFRMRKEIRTLTDAERMRLFDAMNVLYRRGIIARYGRLHATAASTIHRGAAFLPWHRVFLADFEEELRRIDPTVSLPYWDYTMDWDIPRPSESVVWTPCFFGNGNGTITTGRFRGWYGGSYGPIQRNYARPGPPECTSRLITRQDVTIVMEHCYFFNISTGHWRNGPYYVRRNLEALHDGPHDWVGGDMGEIEWSAFDPIFWFHHAFIDFLWERFRRRQENVCGVNPETDYRPDDDSSLRGNRGHALMDRMRGYWHLRNSDGLRNTWTRDFYNYELQPTCPTCGGSPFLYCDRSYDPVYYPNGVCLTLNRPACNMQQRPRQRAFNVSGFGAFGPGDIEFEGEERSTFTPIPEMNRFRGLPGDGRNRDTPFIESRNILMQRTSGSTVAVSSESTTASPPTSPVARFVTPTRRVFIPVRDSVPRPRINCPGHPGFPFNDQRWPVLCLGPHFRVIPIQ